MSRAEETPAERLRIAFELYAIGERIMQQNLRRRHPDASETRIQELLGEWRMKGGEHAPRCIGKSALDGNPQT